MKRAISKTAKRLCVGALILWVSVAAMPALADTVEYIHTDALGTPIAVTDASGAVIQTSEYSPYGQVLNRSMADGPGYTGHVEDVATGLVYMQQRYYDFQIGLFISVDSKITLEDQVILFNRYRYSNENPYLIRDPDGREGIVSVTQNRDCGGEACPNPPVPVQPSITNMNAITVRPDASLGSLGWQGSAFTVSSNIEAVGAYGAGIRYGKDVISSKNSLGIVMVGVGARYRSFSKFVSIPGIDLFKVGYNWGYKDAPVHIDGNVELGPVGVSTTFNPEKGMEISLGISPAAGSYTGISVMFDDTVFKNK